MNSFHRVLFPVYFHSIFKSKHHTVPVWSAFAEDFERDTESVATKRSSKIPERQLNHSHYDEQEILFQVK